MTERYRRFRDISVSERILNTAFLLTIGIGYVMALANLYFTHQGRDGRAGLTIEDIVVIKRIAVIIPFAAMLLDVLSWFITKSIPSFAYAVVASGALMGFSMGLQILLSIYQMWFYSKTSPK